MSGPMPDHSANLAEALVAVYPHHVRRRAPHVMGLEAAVEEGAAWLQSELELLLSQPFSQQRRGPLEVFQEAMRFPTARLADLGVEPIPRDPMAERALPGDLYDLAPASTRDLGEEVWAIHLAWGATKAAAITLSGPESPGDGDG